jgi:hypothetical protein
MSGKATEVFALTALRGERSADLTLRNLMEALRLSYELRAHYRVFEFEAKQEGHLDTARLFAELGESEGDQVASLLRGLRLRLCVATEDMAGEPA